MADDPVTPPPVRRVPGSSRAGPVPFKRRVLSEAALGRMRAAVDAAHASQADQATAPGHPSMADAEPDTEPIPRMRAALAAQTKAPAKSRRWTSMPARPAEQRVEPEQPDVRPSPAQTPQARVRELVGPQDDKASVKPYQTAPVHLVADPSTPEHAAATDRAGLDHTAGPRSEIKTRKIRPRPVRLAGGRWPRIVSVASAAVALTAIGSVALALSFHGAVPPHAGSHQTAGQAATLKRVAAWVAANVSRSAIVACDKTTCRAIAADNFPGQNLQTIGPKSPYPKQANVVVVTPSVRREFGSSLATDWAPMVLARFGSGSQAVLVRVMSAQGATSYEASLRADTKQRKLAGADLLQSRYLTLSGAARQQLATGQVDARLIIVITALCATAPSPVDILAFGTVYAGQSPQTPLRTVDLSETPPGVRSNRSAYVRYIRHVLEQVAASYSNSAEFTASSAGPIRNASGKTVFRIEFGAPSPLGLFNPQNP
jgi:hypothetical protein